MRLHGAKFIDPDTGEEQTPRQWAEDLLGGRWGPVEALEAPDPDSVESYELCPGMVDLARRIVAEPTEPTTTKETP